jgi:hypothetical protein
MVTTLIGMILALNLCVPRNPLQLMSFIFIIRMSPLPAKHVYATDRYLHNIDERGPQFYCYHYYYYYHFYYYYYHYYYYCCCYYYYYYYYYYLSLLLYYYIIFLILILFIYLLLLLLLILLLLLLLLLFVIIFIATIVSRVASCTCCRKCNIFCGCPNYLAGLKSPMFIKTVERKISR